MDVERQGAVDALMIGAASAHKEWQPRSALTLGSSMHKGEFQQWDGISGGGGRLRQPQVAADAKAMLATMGQTQRGVRPPVEGSG